MINEADLRKMSASERRQLAHALARIDYPEPLTGIDLARRRRLGLLLSLIACVVLAGWIVVLEFTLRRGFHTHYWRGAWVGFDIILLAAFAATGRAFWRGRQIVIACLIVTATLLCCDAWFDVVLDSGTADIWGSVASALLVELPLAFVMFAAAGRLIRLSALVAVSERGEPGETGARLEDSLPPLWKIPLFGGFSATRDKQSR